MADIVLDSFDGLVGVFADVQRQIASIDYSSQFECISEELQTIHAGYFDAETGPSGSRWTDWYFRQPSAPSVHPILNVTGRLRGSLADGTASSDHVQEITNSFLIWGTSVPYSYQHQDGGEYTVGNLLIGRRGGTRLPGQTINLPQREHVGLNDENLQPLVEGTADFIVGQLGV